MTPPARILRQAADRTPDRALARLLATLADASDHHPGGDAGLVATLTHPAIAVARGILGTVTAPQETEASAADRRARYAAAIREADGWVLDDGQHMIDAVMAVADSEIVAAHAVLPAPVDRAAVLREAIATVRTIPVQCTALTGPTWFGQGWEDAIREFEEIAEHLADEAQQPECTASISGSCLAERQSDGACDTEAGECVHGGRPADEAQQPTECTSAPCPRPGDCRYGCRAAADELSREAQQPAPAVTEEEEPEAPPLAVGDRYECRTRARTVTITRLWVDEYGADAVAFEWRGGMSAAAHSVDMFHQLYRPAL